ncbi:MAG TPA: twin-arginine translocation pathway signal protein, partial [Blastocatellia bacterium]
MKRNLVEETLTARHLSRRQLLGLIGATAAAPLVGCVRDQSAASAATTPDQTPAALASTAAPSCVVRPQQTAGPYFVDEKLNRSDIRSDPTDGGVRQGLPLRLVMRVTK